MNTNVRANVCASMIATALLSGVAGATPSHAQGSTVVPGVSDQTPQLSAAQRSSIYVAVSQEKSKVRVPIAFDPTVGTKVPPSIALYALPVNTLIEIPSIRAYQYTIVHDQIVLVDPTTLQIVDVIKP